MNRGGVSEGQPETGKATSRHGAPLLLGPHGCLREEILRLSTRTPPLGSCNQAHRRLPEPLPKALPLSPIEQAELDKFLEENLASGRNRPSKSPMAAPFFFVKKKDGSL